ncbi:uncharacterized protein LOC111276494 isoform X1 [Durio zibethinus]|uniref:Uncharacterized protein LOC111276494 isoform X1 n=1 Tax=Durio zibethinus TaxID=66656 RepID=A0A6P5WPC0_DURZI|nr:uncharacterized protein LOC111276494 isoform X1 [Durio zibethinus]
MISKNPKIWPKTETRRSETVSLQWKSAKEPFLIFLKQWTLQRLELKTLNLVLPKFSNFCGFNPLILEADLLYRHSGNYRRCSSFAFSLVFLDNETHHNIFPSYRNDYALIGDPSE